MEDCLEQKKESCRDCKLLLHQCGRCAKEHQNFTGWIRQLIAEQRISLTGYLQILTFVDFIFFCLLCFCVFLCVHKRTVASQPECSCSGNLRLFLLKGFEDQQAFPPGFTALLEEPVAAEVFSPVHPTLVVPYLTSTWIMLFADCLSSTMTSMDSS